MRCVSEFRHQVDIKASTQEVIIIHDVNREATLLTQHVDQPNAVFHRVRMSPRQSRRAVEFEFAQLEGTREAAEKSRTGSGASR